MNSPTDPQLGRVLGGQYRIDALLGQGGMGAVYRGIQLSVQRPVAIKLIHAGAQNQSDLLARFRREAEATARLSHPNTVRLFDFGVTDREELFMVMELLEGEDLAVHLSRGPLPLLEALHILREVLLALSEAHALGIVHRDLKPGNVFLSQVRGGETFIKVMDFGIAGLEQTQGGQKLTLTGAVMGTPAYMSPEQAQGQPVDPRSDLYSIGVMLFEMLTGQPPFDADTLMSILLAHVTQPPKRLDEVGLSLPNQAAVQHLLDALLAKQPASRPPSAAEALLIVDALIAHGAGPAPLTTGPLRVVQTAPTGQLAAPLTPLGWARSRASIAAPASARGSWIAGAVIALAIAGLALWMFSGLDREPAAAVGNGGRVLQPAAAGASAVLQEHAVLIASTPSGARVFENDVELGKTPFRFAFKRDTQLQLRLPGFLAQRVNLSSDSEPTLAIALLRETAHDAPATVQTPESAAAAVSDAAAAPLAPATPEQLREKHHGQHGHETNSEPDDCTGPGCAREASEPAKATPIEAPRADDARVRRDALLKRAPPFPSIASAQKAYSAGKIGADAYEDAVWVLKTRRNERIEIEKDNLKQGKINAQEYEWRLGRIDAELRGE